MIKWHSKKRQFPLWAICLIVLNTAALVKAYGALETYKLVNQETLATARYKAEHGLDHYSLLEAEIASFLNETMDHDFNPKYQTPPRRP